MTNVTTIRGISGERIDYVLTKDNYKTVYGNYNVLTTTPADYTINLDAPSESYVTDMTYTVDKDSNCQPLIDISQFTDPSDIQINSHGYVLSPYHNNYQYIIDDNNYGANIDNFTKIGEPRISKDGVVSNFNYSSPDFGALVTPTIDFGTNDYEMVMGFKINEWTSSEYQCMFAQVSNVYFNIAVTSSINGNYYIHSNSADGSSWHTGIIGTTELQLNKDYLVKVTRVSGVRYMYLSEDNGETWSEEGHIEDPYTYSLQYLIGRGGASNVFHGSVDLSKTYIKVNNEMAWKPTWNKMYDNYRGMGTVNVNNNIASQFHYGAIVPSYRFESTTFDVVMKVSTPSSFDGNNYLLYDLTKGYAIVLLQSNGGIYSYLNGNWQGGNYRLSTNSNYWFRIHTVNNVVYCYYKLYENENECPQTDSMTLAFTITNSDTFLGHAVRFGGYSDTDSGSEWWRGTIDLSKCFIYINDEKVWEYKNIRSINGSFYGYNGVTSNRKKMWWYNSSNYLILDNFNLGNKTWEWVLKINTGSRTGQFIGGYDYGSEGIEVGISSNKMIWWLGTVANSYDIANGQVGTHTYDADKDYWIKMTFDGTKYQLFYSEDGIDYTLDITTNSTSPIFSYKKVLGYDRGGAASPWGGSIDLTESYMKVDNNKIWEGTSVVCKVATGILEKNTDEDIFDESQTFRLYKVTLSDKSTRLFLTKSNKPEFENAIYYEFVGTVSIPLRESDYHYNYENDEWELNVYTNIDVSDYDYTFSDGVLTLNEYTGSGTDVVLPNLESE